MIRIQDRSSSFDALDRWHVQSSALSVEPEIIGKGKFGEVRLAEWYGTRVAVKYLYNYDVKENAALFEGEIRLMKELHHPCVVQFLGFNWSCDGKLSLVMEYLSNGSLEDYVRRYHSRIQHEQKLKWCIEMAQSLAYLHNRRPNFLIHRDVKPTNFMLSPSLVCKLGDFGVSRLFARPSSQILEAQHPAEQRETSRPPLEPKNPVLKKVRSNEALNALLERCGLADVKDMEQTSNVGTARYMAPEVMASEYGQDKTKYSVQVDVFSLGMVYYFVFEGIPPRVGNAITPEAHFSALRNGERPAFTSSTPPGIRQVIDLCLRLRPMERPTSRELITLLAGVSFPKRFALFSSPREVKPEALAAEKLWKMIEKRQIQGNPLST